jgi:STE24 endopeptidase
MHIFTYIFLIAVIIAYSLQFWLSRRQIDHVRAHRSAVPDAFKETISLEAHQKAANYTIAKSRLGKIESALDCIVLLYFTLGGGINVIAELWTPFGMPSVLTGICVIMTAFLAIHIIDLPLNLYKTFVLEQQYGFNRSTPRQFLIDQALELFLGLIIGAPLLALILWVMERAGEFWWLLAWAILVGFSLLMSWIFPTLIAPLFNKFTPLADEGLKERIHSLLDRCGFRSKGIFVMDGSRRSGHGNAYFTGIGSHKRIVFFDTLIESLEHEELEAVLAHELGHFKRKHVVKMLVATSLMSLAGFAILGWLAEQPWFYSSLGVAEPSRAAALLLFILVSPVFTVFLQPVIAAFQRKHEFEADNFASAFANPAAMISALVKLYRDNASTLTPDPLYSAFHYSHPPAAIRIANLSKKMDATAAS